MQISYYTYSIWEIERAGIKLFFSQLYGFSWIVAVNVVRRLTDRQTEFQLEFPWYTIWVGGIMWEFELNILVFAPRSLLSSLFDVAPM